MNDSVLDTDFYRSLYEDLWTMSERQLRKHWLDQGEKEGRFGSSHELDKCARERGIDSAKFSPREYLLLNPDLPVDLLAGDLALHHLVTRGLAENRNYSLDAFTAGERRGGVNDYLKQLTESVNVQSTHEAIATLHFAVKGRIPWDSEINLLASQVDTGESSLSELFKVWVREESISAQHYIERECSNEHRNSHAGASVNQSASMSIFGDSFSRLLSLPSWYTPTEWMERFQQVSSRAAPLQKEISCRESKVVSSWKPCSKPDVTVLCSIFKGEAFVEAFIKNMQDQDFVDNCEIFFVLVQPSNLVREVIAQFADSFPYTKVIEVQEEVSIYAAWNYAIRHSSGRYITNANVDDTRRQDSLRLQFEYLESHPKVDIVFQDYFLTHVPHIPWSVIEEIACRTNLSEIEAGELPDGMIVTHSAPMWRRSLHNQIGFFNPALESAGDSDFFLRCILAQRVFAKSSEIHAAYFANPQGLSTRVEGPGVQESETLYRRYWWLLRRGLPVH